ncbi:phage tail tape measure protein [Bacillus carboniphilus]|uniref:Phage tail tape measure protein n=1 Tax=Bacillus carboniphilus TaxID=86663 RepID=A0ABY9JTB2_9BACI|nr:phage tail tape measure protein [Bacillus carboniphilus]WLR41670.1 phage tail tape measure protein [Bacillus carboniphilus]
MSNTFISMTEINQFNIAVAQTETKLEQLGQKLDSIGDLFASLSVPIVGAGKSAISTGMSFEAGMSQVAAVTNATSSELTSFEEKARQIGETTQFSSTEAANAFTALSKAGWETEEMLSGIDNISALAAASNQDLASTADVVADSLNAFGKSALIAEKLLMH